jgi:signal transduction histidine kinase
MTPSRAPARLGSADLNARILHPLARWASTVHGASVAAALAAAGGLTIADLDGRSRWISVEQFEAVLSYARSLCETDEAFQEACTFELKESYGAIRFVFWATSIRAVMVLAAKTLRVVSSISTCEVLESTATSLVARYTATKAESRLSCLSRQAQFAALPLLFGLPRARIEERSCRALGHEACTYEVRWFAQRRWMPTLLGFGSGCAALAAVHAPSLPIAVAASLPALGAALGQLYELRRTARLNLDTAHELNAALSEIVRDDAEARRELLELHQRQRDWVRLIEEQVGDRTKVLEDVVAKVNQLQATRVTNLLGFSHDLRNPLAVLRSSAEFLEAQPHLHGEEREAVDDLLRAVHTMERLLRDLMSVASSDAGVVKMTPQRMEVAPMVERLRRRLRALVHGREIRASVFSTREAPESIETDALLFDRVVDNLLTNAAKYTERGSIVLEIGGIPGFLTIKVSDSGLGMDQGTIESIFRAKGTGKDPRVDDSYGVGLAVVVRLLAQIGGRLDVMSKPGVGTTFWAHFPVAIRGSATLVAEPSKPDLPSSEVVTIRKVENG